MIPLWNVGEYEEEECVLCWFETAPVDELVQALGEYLKYSRHDGKRNSNVVVVSIAYTFAATVLGRRLCCDDGLHAVLVWILQGQDGDRAVYTKLGYLLGLVESCSILDEDHCLHYSNFVPMVSQHVLSRVNENGECMGPDCSLYPVEFCSLILDRLSFRGFSKYVAESIIEMCASMGGQRQDLSLVIEHVSDHGNGMKTLVTELLVQLASADVERPTECIMKELIPRRVWNACVQIRLQLGDVVLTKGILDKKSLDLLIRYLDLISHAGDEIHQDYLLEALGKVVSVWSCGSLVSMSNHQQKMVVHCIIGCLGRITKDRIQSNSEIVPRILSGISTYLQNPKENVRHMGMCVGNALSSLMSPDKPMIFTDADIEESIKLHPSKSNQEIALQRVMKVTVERKEDKEIETDSDDESCSEPDSEFGLQEDLSDIDQEEPERSIQLQELSKKLTSSEENWKDQLEAISMAAELIKAAPSELDLYCEGIARGLMYARLPPWAQEESAGTSSKTYDDERLDALLALVIELPERVGSYLIDVFYSSSSDIQHRARSLQILSSSTKLMSEKSLSTNSDRMVVNDGSGHSRQVGKILLEWSAKLLASCDKNSHGIDLFGKDTYLLGCFICTLGNFLEACSGTQEALYLGTAVLRLIQSDVIQHHQEVFVRRSALAASAQAISSVPLSCVCTNLAESMLGISSSSDALISSNHMDITSREFLALMADASKWFKVVSESDIDSTCQKLGQGASRYVELLTLDALDAYSKQARARGAVTDDLQIKALKKSALFARDRPLSLPIRNVTVPKENGK